MKILVHDYGGYPFTRQLAENLASRGHQVEYCFSQTTQVVQRSKNETSFPGLAIIGITLEKPFEKYSFVQRRRAEIEHGRLLAHHIKKFKPHVVISANTPLDAQKLAIKMAHSNHSRFIFWFQDAIGVATIRLLSRKYHLVGALIGLYYSRMEKKMVRGSQKAILIADDFFPLMKSWKVPAEHIAVIPNWAPLKEIPVLPRGNKWALENHLSGKFVYLYSGILGMKHDPQLFIALAQAFHSVADIRIVIIAEGIAVDGLQEQKKRLNLENMILLPYQLADVYPQVLASADVLMSILSPDAGIFSVPSKVLSYMCAARPLLLAVPQENLAARLVKDNHAGLVCSPTDSAQWVANAWALYRDHETRQRMGENARKYAQTNFDIDRITDRFEELF